VKDGVRKFAEWYTRYAHKIYIANDFKFMKNMFLCPVCKIGAINLNTKEYLCDNNECRTIYSTINNIPVLINFNKSLLDKQVLFNNNGISQIKRNNSLIIKVFKKILFGNGKNTQRNIQFISKKLREFKSVKILVVGGGSIGLGLDSFYKEFINSIDSFDIYYSPFIDFIADAHSIPIKDNYYDLIILQAVLEHVLDPIVVVDECYRVLKDGGFIYSETPFMQQVHEGAYDFTRFTNSGHRNLFNRFYHVKSGANAGVGTTLLWSISYFMFGLFRSKKIKIFTRCLFFWLRYFDMIVSEKFNIDGASGNYFIGKKDINFKYSFKSIVNFYQGSQ
jgi:SAM-dependent methyltransferase